MSQKVCVIILSRLTSRSSCNTVAFANGGDNMTRDANNTHHHHSHHHHTELDDAQCDSSLISRRGFLSVAIPGAMVAAKVLAQQPADQAERFRKMSADAERAG